MSNPYTPVAVSGWNQTPPSDDGAQTAANQVTWAKSRDKLSQPLKTALESINTNVNAAFATVDDASNLSTGTLPDGRFPATLPAASGANLTALNATNLASGTVPDARFPATLPALSGVNLTSLNGTNIASGTVADARLSSNVPLKDGSNTFLGTTQKISAVAAAATWRSEETGSGRTVDLFATATIAGVGTGSNHAFGLYANSTLFMELSGAGNFDFKAGTVTTENTSASEVGYKGVPRVSKTADHTVAAVDAGTELVLSSAADDITVQASGAPPEGSIVFLDNAIAGSVDIIQGSGMTLTLDGTATTGSRTLAQNGRAYIRFTSSSTAKVGGPGVA